MSLSSKDNYYNKYFKYKNKYLQLKKQIGGNLFEYLFVPLVNYCLEYNNSQTEMGRMFGQNRFVHIKGGSSIKYYMIKNNMDSTNITSDLDLFLVTSEEEKMANIESFYTGLKAQFPDKNIQIGESNGLITISIDGITMIDITIFSENFEDPDPETSMFKYALDKIGYMDYNEYFSQFYLTDDYDDKSDDEKYQILQVQAFTSLEFEMYACEKGIQVQNNYLTSSADWPSYANFYKNKSEDIRLSQVERAQMKKIYERYLYQSEPSYIEKIKNKRDRYNYKLMVIKSMLGLQ